MITYNTLVTVLVTFTCLNLLDDRCEFRKNKNNKSTSILLILLIASGQINSRSIFRTTSTLSQNTHSDTARASITSLKMGIGEGACCDEHWVLYPKKMSC